MRRPIIFTAALILLSSAALSAQQDPKRVSKDIELVKLSDHAYVYVSYSEIPPFGRVGSNGLLLVDERKAFLFDTPATDTLTKILVTWIQDTMGLKIAGFVPNHWHNDCMGGLGYLKSVGILCYANAMTIKIAKSKHLPVPDSGFSDSLLLKLGGKEIVCCYPGPAHTVDNIVVWFPSERILFAGCMVKSMESTNLGNTADGDEIGYFTTVKHVLEKYRDARLVIPGHGDFGGIELLKHTLRLAGGAEED